MSKKKAKKKGSIFTWIGILFFLAALGLTAYNEWDGWRANQASQKIVRELDKEIPGKPENQPGWDENREMPTKTINGYKYIGTLYIPKLKLKLPVMASWNYDKLKIAVCRYSGSVYKNNMVIAGHNYARHFSPVKRLPIGTKIVFTDVEGFKYTYNIGWKEVLQPEETKAMVSKGKNEQWDLTLFTCTTGGSSRATMRCISKKLHYK
ncbi:MAG: sortase [Lachnospiraceae bacterium]|nr:sortase [Lachnospiraceae bacterium]